jgi:hypothetical protein
MTFVCVREAKKTNRGQTKRRTITKLLHMPGMRSSKELETLSLVPNMQHLREGDNKKKQKKTTCAATLPGNVQYIKIQNDGISLGRTNIPENNDVDNTTSDPILCAVSLSRNNDINI